MFSAPSEGKHHANDYFSESENAPTTEKMLEEADEKRDKEKRKRRQKMKIKNKINKKAQFGTGGGEVPHLDNTPTGGNSWYDQRINEIKKTPLNKNEQDSAISNNKSISSQSIELMRKTTYTIKSIFSETGEFGTGFFFSPNKILTCAHVVSKENQHATKITIKIEQQEYDCKIISSNEAMDVAVLESINYNSEQYLQLGDSNNIELGDDIVVYGSPLGFEDVVQPGIVSSKPTPYEEDGVQQKFIFISANIASGNSGSPVISTKDNTVISIACGSISLNKGSGSLSASVPINDVKQLIEKGYTKSEASYEACKKIYSSIKNCGIEKKANIYTMVKEAAGSHDPETVKDLERIISHLEKFIGVEDNVSIDNLELFIRPLSIGSKRIVLRPYKLVGMVKRLDSLAKEYKRELPEKNHNVLREIRRDFILTLKNIKTKLKKDI